MVLTMDPPLSSMGTGPLIFRGKPMEYFCKGSAVYLESTLLWSLH